MVGRRARGPAGRHGAPDRVLAGRPRHGARRDPRRGRGGRARSGCRRAGGSRRAVRRAASGPRPRCRRHAGDRPARRGRARPAGGLGSSSVRVPASLCCGPAPGPGSPSPTYAAARPEQILQPPATGPAPGPLPKGSGKPAGPGRARDRQPGRTWSCCTRRPPSVTWSTCSGRCRRWPSCGRSRTSSIRPGRWRPDDSPGGSDDRIPGFRRPGADGTRLRSGTEPARSVRRAARRSSGTACTAGSACRPARPTSCGARRWIRRAAGST